MADPAHDIGLATSAHWTLVSAAFVFLVFHVHRLRAPPPLFLRADTLQPLSACESQIKHALDPNGILAHQQFACMA